MTELISMGEILIDLLPRGDNDVFQASPGGAPANLACVLASLGHTVAVAGKIGSDSFGTACLRALDSFGVNTEFVFRSQTLPTTLSVVHLDEFGNRSFSFYRKGTADTSLSRKELRQVDFQNARFFHFGSVSMTEPGIRTVTLEAAQRARAAGCTLSFDPNLRLSLWADEEQARAAVLQALPLVDILKLSLEEGRFLFNEISGESICRAAAGQYGIPLIIVTMAEQGCVAMVGDRLFSSRAYDVPVLDTTGAGDAFLGGVLHCLMTQPKPPELLTEKEITAMLGFANAFGSLVTTKKGAVASIPALEEVSALMKRDKRVPG